MEVIKNTGNYIVFGEDEEPDEGIWTDYKTETDRKIREYIEDLSSGESDTAGGLPHRPCAGPLRARYMPSPPRAGHVAGKARRASDRVLIHIDTQKEKS